MFILFDDAAHSNLFPLTFTRPSCELRLGIVTIREKWEMILGERASFITRDYLSEKYPLYKAGQTEFLLINGRLLPNKMVLTAINNLKIGELLVKNDIIVAALISFDDLEKLPSSDGLIWNEGLSKMPQIEYDQETVFVERCWNLFQYNDAALRYDFEMITKNRVSQPLSDSNKLIGDASQLFIEEGAVVEGAILNTKSGPIYVGAHAEIMEGSLVRGGLAMCEHSALKLGTKIYGACTFGPHVKIGGEVNNSVVLGYSNKGHDGFLGNSVLGEWCNLGADTNNSNLKNNYAEVKVWDYNTRRFVGTGLTFCGLIMGDHSKAGINTMFNTGTVVGVSANIFGAGFPRNYIPSFAWGGAQSMTDFSLPKSYEVAERMMERRKVAFTDADKRILEKVMEMDGFK